MQNRFLEARRTARVDAAPDRFVLLAPDVPSAHRAGGRHAERTPVRAGRVHAHDLGDHVSAALDHHLIADLELQTRDLVLVVQRRPRDGDAADLDRPQVRDGSQRAGPPDLHLDVFDHRHRLAGGVFECDRPARGLGGPAQAALLRNGVDLDHHAVDFVRQLFAPRFPFGAKRKNLARLGATAAVRVDFETQPLELGQRLPMGCPQGFAIRQQRVGVKIQLARRGDGGIQHAERTGRRVARIGEAREPLLVPARVQPFEGAPRHDGFSPNLQALRAVRQAQRQGADGPRVGGDVFADRAIAAGHRLRQDALAVVNRQRQAVEFQFAHECGGLAAQQRIDPAEKLAQFALVQGVVQTQHRRRMRHLDEALPRRAADALRGRIRSHRLRMLRFELLQAAHQRVVLRVADLGLV